MDSESQLQRVLELSRQMLEAGQGQSWEELISLERSRSEVLSSIRISGNDGHFVPLLQEIQHCDEELREKLEAWMKHAEKFLHRS